MSYTGSVKLLILTVLVLLFGFSEAVLANDILQVMPTRVVIAQQRTDEITLVNRGSSEGQYRILLKNKSMTDTGSFAEFDKTAAPEWAADKFIRYSPRSVRISDGGFQKIRLMIKKPSGLAPGEYRTHMVFRSSKEQKNPILEPDQELSFSFEPIVEISIPIIVRHGKLTATVAMDNIKLEGSDIYFSIKREGTRSLYGDLKVYLVSASSDELLVGFRKGIAVYYPNEARNMRLKLDLPELKGAERFKLVFEEDPYYGGDLQATSTYKYAL